MKKKKTKKKKLKTLKIQAEDEKKITEYISIQKKYPPILL
jgi:hypothetical protein